MKKLTIVLLMILMGLTVSADEFNEVDIPNLSGTNPDVIMNIDFGDAWLDVHAENGRLRLELTSPMDISEMKNLLRITYNINLYNYIELPSDFRGWFYRELNGDMEVNLYRFPNSSMVGYILIWF